MNSIYAEVKNLSLTSVQLLNQPIIKEGVKNIAGSVTFLFGLVELYDVYQISRGPEILTQHVNTSKWILIANKVTIVCAKISLILSAGVSRPGAYIISSVAGCVFSTAQLDRIFGPNTLFAINPRHPRHVVSIAAVILALPSFIQSTYKGINWAYKKIRQYQNLPADNPNDKLRLTETKIRSMAFFNTITSRPALHIGNHLGRYIFRPT